MISNKLLYTHPKFRVLHSPVHFSYQFTLASHTNHNTISPSKYLKILLLPLAFILLYRKSWISRYVYEKDTA